MAAGLKFRADSEIVHRIFEEKFGGIANFADEWTNGDTSTDDAESAERSVKTIYAWLKHGLPTTKDTLFKFFGALSIDPMAGIDFDRDEIRRNFGRLRRAFMLGGINAGGFRPLFELYRPSTGWPDNGLSRTYYGQNWTIFDFEHEADNIANTYVTINVQAEDELPVNWPRAYHIAYRRKLNADGLWRPFGTVVSRFGEAILAHENGNVQRMAMPCATKHRLSFQTYFGPSPAQFRVVSLHPFKGEVDPRPDPAASLYFVG